MIPFGWSCNKRNDAAALPLAFLFLSAESSLWACSAAKNKKNPAFWRDRFF